MKYSSLNLNHLHVTFTVTASLSSISTPVGCILGGYLMDVIGRRRTLILTELPLIIGWLLIFSANSVYMIYGESLSLNVHHSRQILTVSFSGGRLLVGFGSGMVGAPARVYTGEVTQPHLRGMLLALSSVGVSLGVLIEYSLGTSAFPGRYTHKYLVFKFPFSF